MLVNEFEKFLEESKKEFRNILESGLNSTEFVVELWRKCCSNFEETVLIESLNEIYKEYQGV